jgi:aryl-alcohol dehydrogenase-like predicted oxidoreductase
MPPISASATLGLLRSAKLEEAFTQEDEMKKRTLGKTGAHISEIGLGTWQLGAKWGSPFNPEEAHATLDAAVDNGITFIDTADVYNDTQSETAIGKFLKGRFPDATSPFDGDAASNRPWITSKCGRQLDPHTADMYQPAALEKYLDDSLRRLQLDRLDMILLHCPPTPVYQRDDIFAWLDSMVEKGKLASYGVSVEKVSEGLAAMDYNVSAIEVIYNMFRLKPERELFPVAKKNDVGIIVRVPLASGLLSGKYTQNTTFGAADHRTTNRNGEEFDKGETFSGVDFDLGLRAVDELKKIFGTENLAPIALRWILMNDAVSVVIPGASRHDQITRNVEAAQLPPLTAEQMKAVEEVYDEFIAPSVEPLW